MSSISELLFQIADELGKSRESMNPFIETYKNHYY